MGSTNGSAIGAVAMVLVLPATVAAAVGGGGTSEAGTGYESGCRTPLLLRVEARDVDAGVAPPDCMAAFPLATVVAMPVPLVVNLVVAVSSVAKIGVAVEATIARCTL